MARDLEPQVLIRRAAALALAVVVALLGWATVIHLREEAPPPPPPVRLDWPAPPGADPGAGDDPLDAAISPDETRAVFVATQNGVARLWTRAVDTGVTKEIAGTDGARLPAWDRTGQAVAYFDAQALRRLSLDKGGAVRLADAPSPSGATWLADGSVLFAPTSDGPIRRHRDGQVSDATSLGPGERGHVFPVATGTGDSFVYVVARADGRREARLVEGGRTYELTTTSGHAQLVGDWLVHVRDGVLVGVGLDPKTRQVVGRSVVLAAAAGVGASGQGLFAVSPRLLLAASPAVRRRTLTWRDGTGRTIGRVGDPADYWQVRLSPDGRHTAVTAMDPLLRTLDVSIVPTERPGPAVKLSLALAADSDPVWSPDGTRVAFRSFEDGRPKVFSRRAHDPKANIEPVLDGRDTPTDWRGTAILVARPGTGNTDVSAYDLRSKTYAEIAASGFNERDARWSGNGTWVAFVSDESGRPDIYAVPATRGGAAPARTRVSFDGGTHPRWSGDGRALYFLRDGSMMRARMNGDAFETPEAIFDAPDVRDFDVSRQADRLLLLLPARSDAPLVTAIVNWRSLLKADTPGE